MNTKELRSNILALLMQDYTISIKEINADCLIVDVCANIFSRLLVAIKDELHDCNLNENNVQREVATEFLVIATRFARNNP